MGLPAALVLGNDAGEGYTYDDQEFLMNVEHQVLQVGVYTRLRVDRRLLVRQQVVELHDTNSDDFLLLRFEHLMFQYGVFDDLVGDDGCELARLRHIPPVVTVERCVQVVS